MIKISNETYIYNIGQGKQSTKHHFMDAFVKYTVERNKFTLKLIGRNLLHQNLFKRRSVNGYSENLSQYNLVPMHALLEVSYKF